MGGNRASGVHMVYAARFLYVSERIRILELELELEQLKRRHLA